MDTQNTSIKPTEIETVMLNSQVITPFCISWSDDDKISVVAEGGVYIFELWPTPSSDQATVTFFKSWIPASQTTPLTDAVIDDKNGFFVWGLERKEAYEAVLDSTLSYVVHKPNVTFTNSHIIQCKFSPLINNKSYISCLTNYGLLEIFKRKSSKWVPFLNVSELWIAHSNCRTNFIEINFNYFKSKMYELKITAMEWYKNEDIIFLTCHESGIIVIWNTEIYNNGLELSVRHCLPVNEKACCIKLSPTPYFNYGHLFIGTVSGLIKYSLVNLEKGEINQDFFMWENQDSMVPSLIEVTILSEETFVLTVKRHILLIQCLALNSENKFELKDTIWEEFSTEITSVQKYYGKFIVCLQSHDVYELSIKDSKTHNVKLINTGVKQKHKVSHHCYGLTMSQNGAIWMVISSPKANYDSLKEITHLIVYSTEIKKFKSLTDTSATSLIEKITREEKESSLSEFYDLLILKKFELLLDNSKFKMSYDLNPNFPLLNLQLMLWEVKLKLFNNIPENEEIVNGLELLIAKEPAKKILVKFGNLQSISDMERRSLIACQAFLIKDNRCGKSSCGICSICGEDTFFESIRISSCVYGHRFPRCCLSLLPCDVCPYAVCRMCETVALAYFVTESNSRCPYCDGLLELDTRVQVRF